MIKPKLTIELIPSTAWFKNLRTLVGQRNWDIIRKDCYRKANYRCEICNGKGTKWPVECHERWSFIDNKIILDGLIALCPSCHEVKHIGLASVKGRLEIAKKHLMKVNKMTSREADEYIMDSFKLFEKRSREEWELDIDYLKPFLK